jgi:hypothetical protein
MLINGHVEMWLWSGARPFLGQYTADAQPYGACWKYGIRKAPPSMVLQEIAMGFSCIAMQYNPAAYLSRRWGSEQVCVPENIPVPIMKGHFPEGRGGRTAK